MLTDKVLTVNAHQGRQEKAVALETLRHCVGQTVHERDGRGELTICFERMS